MTKINLGIHLGFLTTRYNDPKIWTDLVRNEFNLSDVQFVSDLIDPSLPDKIIQEEIKKVNYYAKKHSIRIKHTMTSHRNNYMGSTNKKISIYWKEWIKKFIKISSLLGAEGAGSLLGIFTFDDFENNYSSTRKKIINGWLDLAKFGKKCGLKYLIWEPMSVPREMGDTIKDTRSLHYELNKKSVIPILLNLDVDHGNHTSKDKNDHNPYKWIEKLGHLSPSIHLKQKTKDIFTHKPFIKKYNKIGIIKPNKVISSIKKSKIKECTLYFEFSFREREPFDSRAIKDIKESVNYWRDYINV